MSSEIQANIPTSPEELCQIFVERYGKGPSTDLTDYQRGIYSYKRLSTFSLIKKEYKSKTISIFSYLMCMACCPDWVKMDKNTQVLNTTIDEASNTLLQSNSPTLRDTAFKISALLRRHQLLGYLEKNLGLTNHTKIIKTNRFLYASHTSFGRMKINQTLKGKKGETSDLIFDKATDKAMNAFGYFLYHDRLPEDLSKETFIELLEMAHLFDIEGLNQAENGLADLAKKEEDLQEIYDFTKIGFNNALILLKKACAERLEGLSKGKIKFTFNDTGERSTLSILSNDLSAISPIDLRVILPLCTALKIAPSCLFQLKFFIEISDYFPDKSFENLTELHIESESKQKIDLSKIELSHVFPKLELVIQDTTSCGVCMPPRVTGPQKMTYVLRTRTDSETPEIEEKIREADKVLIHCLQDNSYQISENRKNLLGAFTGWKRINHKLSNATCPAALYRYLFSHPNNLNQIYLKGALGVDSDAIEMLAKNNKTLVELGLRGCINVKSEALLELLTQNGKSLTLLDLHEWPHINNAILKKIAESCKELIQFGFRNNGKIDNDAIKLFIKNCTKLKELTLGGTSIDRSILNEIGKNLKELTRLSLYGCDKLKNSDIKDLKEQLPKCRILLLRDKSKHKRKRETDSDKQMKPPPAKRLKNNDKA